MWYPKREKRMMPMAKKDWMTTPKIPRFDAPTSSFPVNRRKQGLSKS